MAQVVELFGAPGTGKSTLLRALDGRRIGGRRVVAVGRLRRVARRGPSDRSAAGAPIGSGPARRIMERLLSRDRTTEELATLLARRTADWSAILALLTDAPLGRGSTDPFEPLRAPGWLRVTLENRALADAAPDDLVVVLDEGLAQRVRILCGDAPDAARLARFAVTLPPATLQVHLTADTGTLVARAQRRDRTIYRHRGLDVPGLAASVERDAALLATVAETLRGRGDAVLELATSMLDPEDAARTVITRLDAGPR